MWILGRALLEGSRSSYGLCVCRVGAFSSVVSQTLMEALQSKCPRNNRHLVLGEGRHTEVRMLL